MRPLRSAAALALALAACRAPGTPAPGAPAAVPAGPPPTGPAPTTPAPRDVPTLAGTAPTTVAAGDTLPATVVLVSFDGFRADYLDRPLPLPNFRAVAAEGVRARGLVPSWPSKTFPNHWTLVTGMRPGRHGIVANSFRDPAFDAVFALRDSTAVRDGRWWGGEPLWAAAARRGVRTGVVFWPGSEAAIGGRAATRPWRALPYDERLPNDARVDSVAAWLALPAAERPRFVLLYVSTLDDVGHRHGPDAPETDRALVEVDRVLGRLRAALAASPVANRAHLVIASDHGMRAVTRRQTVDLGACHVPLDGVVSADPGPSVALWFDRIPARERAARREAVRAALDACVRAAGGHATVWRREDTPAAWAVRQQPRAGDLIVAGAPGWQVRIGPARRDTTDPAGTTVTGAHGWDPAADPQMRGIFLAVGPRVAAGRTLDLVDNVDVAPFVARLLDVPAPFRADGDGRSAAAALRPMPPDLLLVLEKDAARARLMDPRTGASLATWPTGPFPHEVALSPDGALAVVADYGDREPGRTLTVLDVPGRRVLRTIDLGAYRRPHGIVWLPTNTHAQRVAVTVEESQAVLVVDVAAGRVTQAIPTNERGTHMLALGTGLPGDTTRAAALTAFTANIGGGTVSQLDLGAGTLVRTVRTGLGPEAMDVTPDGRELWVADRRQHVVQVRDARTLDSLAAFPTGAFPNRLRFTPDGRTALVSNAAAGTLSVYDVPSRTLRGVVAFPYDSTRARPSALTRSIGQGPVPLGVLVARDGRTAVVALAATGQLAVVDLEGLRVVTLLDGGETPDGMGWVGR